MTRFWMVLAAVGLAGACEAGSGSSSSTTGNAGGDPGSGGTGASTGEGGLDFGGSGQGGSPVVDECKVNEAQGDAPPPCDDEDKAPPDSFDPVVQWSWTDPGGAGSLVSALVANFDDDDQNGEVDLCDVPDVVVTTIGDQMYLLSGDTGELKLTFGAPVDGDIQPALAST